MGSEDKVLLRAIMGYCDDIAAAVQRFDLNREKIEEDQDYRAILAFFVQQIGETAGKLSDTFKERHSEIEWPAIVGFRHHIVHAYGKVIPEMLWSTVQNNIPELREFCKSQLRE